MTITSLARIDLADARTASELLDALLLKLNDIVPPVPVKEIAQQLDIIEIRPLEADGFEGALITDRARSKGAILYVASRTPENQRFTIGHELGHFLMYWHTLKEDAGFFCTKEDLGRSDDTAQASTIKNEVEANYFSAGSLFPNRVFANDLSKLGPPDLTHICDLASKYEASKEATARRYVEQHKQSCAVILSRDNKIFRCYRSGDFPFIEIKTLPTASLSFRSNQSLSAPSDFVETSGHLWLPERKARSYEL